MNDEHRETDLKAEGPEQVDDLVRVYLRKMGAVPLLSREGEVEIAKRIEKGRKSALNALSRSPVVVGQIAKYGGELRTGDLNIRNLVECGKDEVKEELLEKRRRWVLRRIDEIVTLEVESEKIRRRLRRCKKSSKTYKRLRWQSARIRISIAHLIRDLKLTSPILQELVEVLKTTVGHIVALEREAKGLQELQESPLKEDEAKKVRSRQRGIGREMKEIEEEVLDSPAGLKRTLALIQEGELEGEIAKKELVEAKVPDKGLRLVKVTKVKKLDQVAERDQVLKVDQCHFT